MELPDELVEHIMIIGEKPVWTRLRACNRHLHKLAQPFYEKDIEPYRGFLIHPLIMAVYTTEIHYSEAMEYPVVHIWDKKHNKYYQKSFVYNKKGLPKTLTLRLGPTKAYFGSCSMTSDPAYHAYKIPKDLAQCKPLPCEKITVKWI